MTHIYTTIDIEAPPEGIWAVILDIEHWAEWTPTIISVRPLDAGPLAFGSRAVVRQPKLLPARWQVTELEAGRGFTWAMRGPGLLVTARHSIEEAAHGSRATLSLEFAGPLGTFCARLTRSLNERYLAIEARGPKKRAEAGAQSRASRIDGIGGSR